MATKKAPDVLWAQRSSETEADKNIIYLTFNAHELQSDYQLTFPTPSTLSFHGHTKAAANPNSTAAAVPEVEWVVDGLPLFGEVETENVQKKLTGKSLQVVLRKKELKDEYWPRLTKDKRVNFVKTDFDRWIDQDEQSGVEVDDGFAGGMGPPGDSGFDMESMMSQMGGGGGGMGGGAGGMDMEALMSQMKAGAGDGAADDDKSKTEDDDEDLPPLENAA